MHLLRRLFSLAHRHWLNAKANVQVRTRDRQGFVVGEYRGHNIYLNVGRDWLLRLLAPKTPIVPGAAPAGTYHDNRIGFIGVGIGGREQGNPGAAAALYANNDNAPPLNYDYYYDPPPGPYPPTFIQDDTDVLLTGLEAPVVYQGTNTSNAKWLMPISLVKFSTSPSLSVTFTAIFDVMDINNAHSDGGGGHPTEVYISEAALYPYELSGGIIIEPDRSYARTRAVAYEAFPQITKTDALQLEVQWTLKL